MHLKVVLVGSKAAVRPSICLSFTGSALDELKGAIQAGLNLDTQDFQLTDFERDITDNAAVGQLCDGCCLHAICASGQTHLLAPARERITFSPHPKTLTMAGDYEYFAAQGHHPFAYALAELIDNSLRATRHRAAAGQPRTIQITFITARHGSSMKGLVCVQDNGSGMSKQDLNDWAVMNLSMEDRGQAPLEPHAQRGQQGAGRFLGGDLSYFGVGSKNAAFFMGRCIKLSTRRANSAYVHELRIAAAELEQRYKNAEAVYEEDLVHRRPGDGSTLSQMEQPFPITQQWVQAEAQTPAGAHAGLGNGSDAGGDGHSFTRVVIGELKPDVLQQLADAEKGAQVCRDLAHLYHYYLHGEQGNRQPGGDGSQATAARSSSSQGQPQGGPTITLQCISEGRLQWDRNLAQVEDDLESCYLKAQQSELAFSLQVPGRGLVSGVLWYFPFADERESVPQGATSMLHRTQSGLSLTQAPPAAAALTQVPSQHLTQVRPSQLQPRATQQRGEELGVIAEQELLEDSMFAAGPTPAPIFETFWQGRLIPGARIDTLPFIEAVRQKRGAAGRDALPDEVFGRLRGALFLGPSFQVTRNKLLFRDNLPELLAAAVPGDRHQDRKFKEWLTQCHATLDKSVAFEVLADAAVQADARSKLGERCTAFEQVVNGSNTLQRGDLVRLAVKPALVGRIQFFSVAQAGLGPGAYSGGRITVQPLPEGLYGPAASRTCPLRRLECKLTQEEAAEHSKRELQKVPSVLSVEPLKLASGRSLQLAAGEAVPSSSVIVRNGAGQRLTKAFLEGQKQQLSVLQRLWRLTEASGKAALAAAAEGGPPAALPAADEAEPPPAKKGRKGKKGAKAAAAAEHRAQEEAAAKGRINLDEAEVVFEASSHVPVKEAFQFERITEGLKRSGCYLLQYTLQPAIPEAGSLTLDMLLEVQPGTAASFGLQGEGRAALASRGLMLGEHAPPLTVQLKDAGGNEVPAAGPLEGLLLTMQTPEGAGVLDLQVQADQVVGDGVLRLVNLQVLGTKEALGKAGLAVFSTAASRTPAPGSHHAAQKSQGDGRGLRADLLLHAAAPGMPAATLPLTLTPGAPVVLQLLPGHPWEAGVSVDSKKHMLALLGHPRLCRFEEAVAELMSGQQVPAFGIQAVDAWGNPAGSTPDVKAEVLLRSRALQPAEALVTLPGGGLLSADAASSRFDTRASAAATGGSVVRASLSLQLTAANPLAEAAIAAAGKAVQHKLSLRVEPSTAPTSIVMMNGDEQLPIIDGSGDAQDKVAVLEGVPAGSTLSDLGFYCCDEAGRPVTNSASGRVQLSWQRGSRRVVLEEGVVCLPPLEVADSITEPMTCWMRFVADTQGSLPVEVGLQVGVVPGPPSTWGMAALDAHSQALPQGEVQCGRPFEVEVTLQDAFGHRCAGVASTAPEPTVEPSSQHALTVDPSSWEKGWGLGGNSDVYTIRMVLSGHPGLIQLTAKDAAGKKGSSQYKEDMMELTLVAGPPAKLVIEGPATISCGTRGVLPQLALRVADAGGNFCTDVGGLEVTLNPSALSASDTGHSATVAAAGGNKAAVKKGAAIFKDVRIAADVSGQYVLRAASGSRKMPLDEAQVTLDLSAANIVSELTIDPASLPAALAPEATLQVAVLVQTDDRKGLEVAAAGEGLVLHVKPPDSGSSEALTLQPMGASSGDCCQSRFLFQSAEPLTVAGSYTVTAEYTEARPDLARALPKQAACIRSRAEAFEMQPGPAAAVTMEATGAIAERLTATNGSAPPHRALLRGAAAQLQDAWGNAVAQAGVRVQLSLQWLPEGPPEAMAGSELPQVEASEGQCQAVTDKQGRAFFGNVGLVEGSGRVQQDENLPDGVAVGGLECLLVAAAGSGRGRRQLASWECPVLFSDDAAKFAALQQLNERQQALQARRQEAEYALQDADKEVAAARKAAGRAAKAVAARQQQVQQPAPESQAAAEAALQEARAGTGQADLAVEQVEARFGPANSSMTAAIKKCLASGDAGVVGVMAQLATVSDPALAAILAAHFRGLLAVVVVQDSNARGRLVAALRGGEGAAVPDILCLTHAAPYRGPDSGDPPGWWQAGDMCHRLVQQACSGTDPALPVQLPHTRILLQLKKGAPAGQLGPKEWPGGCLGYAFNLVRPSREGHRTALLVGLLGQTLVFETLQQASDYREYVTQVLKSSLPDLIMLDGSRISSKGIVAGSSFRVPPWREATICWGSTPEDSTGGASTCGANQVPHLEALVAAFQEQEQADAAQAAAEQAAEAARQEQEVLLQQLDHQIADLDGQLAQQGASQPAGRRGGKRLARKRGGGQAPADSEAAALLLRLREDEAVEGPPAKKTRSAEKQARPTSARRGASAEPAEGKRSKRQRVLSNMQP